MHLDPVVNDLDAATEQVVSLGGKWLEPGKTRELEGFRWRCMSDPEGNEFELDVLPDRCVSTGGAYINNYELRVRTPGNRRGSFFRLKDQVEAICRALVSRSTTSSNSSFAVKSSASASFSRSAATCGVT